MTADKNLRNSNKVRTEENMLRLELGDTSLEKNQPKQTGPRSKLVEAIAVLLFSRPLRSSEIAQILGYSPRYISSYLSYWRYRGLFEYENGFWSLTPEGENFARSIIQREMDTRLQQYTTIARQLIESGSTVPKTISRTRKYKTVLQREDNFSRVQQFIADRTSQTDNKLQNRELLILCLESTIDNEDLTVDEREVLDTLIMHYIKWGTTYLYLDQLEETMNADRTWILKNLRLLQAKGLIYIYNDRRLGTRIGFSKRMRQIISSCEISVSEEH